MVAIAAKVDGQALAGSRRDRRLPGPGRIVLACRDDRIGCVSRGRQLVVCALHQRLFHANAGGGLGANASGEGAVVQHGCADLEQCRGAIRAGCGTRGRMEDVGYGLIAGGLFALTFLVGQLFAWQQLNAAGYFLAANPANAFFYLFTGLHGLHLLGGIVALALTVDKVWRGFEVNQVRLSVQLCAVYWHFLLALWLVLFTLLTPVVGDFSDVCRQWLSRGALRGKRKQPP